MSSELVELFLPIIRALVLLPDVVQIDYRERERSITLVLKVHPSDRGRIIGKQAKTLHSLRQIAQSVATIRDFDCVVELEEDASAHR